MADAIYPVGSVIASSALVSIEKYRVTSGSLSEPASIRINLPENGSTVLGYFIYHRPSTTKPGDIYSAWAMFQPDALTYTLELINTTEVNETNWYEFDIRMSRDSTVCVVEEISVSPMDIIIIKF